MKQLEKKYKTLLENIARSIQNDLEKSIHDNRIIKLSDIIIEKTTTFGFGVNIFKFKKIPGTIQLWLDLLPNIGRPILSVCYNSSDIKRIKKIANSSTYIFNKQANISNKDLNKENGSNGLSKPLPRKYFNTFLIESYQSNFLTCFFFEEIKIEPPLDLPLSFHKKLFKETEWLIRAIVAALDIIPNPNSDYVACENRKVVSEHIRRERSKKLSDFVKRRDNFICRICDFNFAEAYGEKGQGFAEAHHIIALSTLNKIVKTSSEDMITVCSNCHRMLHRMDGERDDYKKLKNSLRK